MGLKRRILRLLLLASIALTVCSCATVRPIVLHPIEKTDIFRIEKGAEISKPDGIKITTEKDGYFLSEYYLEEVMKVRAE